VLQYKKRFVGSDQREKNKIRRKDGYTERKEKLKDVSYFSSRQIKERKRATKGAKKK